MQPNRHIYARFIELSRRRLIPLIPAILCLMAWFRMIVMRRSELRVRRVRFEQRSPVELVTWPHVHGIVLKMHVSWVTAFLMVIGEAYKVDPRRLLPTDRLGVELGFPSGVLNELVYSEGMFESIIITLNIDFSTVWSLPQLSGNEQQLDVRTLLVWLDDNYPLTEPRGMHGVLEH